MRTDEQSKVFDARSVTLLFACLLPVACGEAGSSPGHADGRAGYLQSEQAESCTPEPSCDPSEPGSIVQRCAAENRSCDDTSGDAECGKCLQGSKLVCDSCLASDCGELACPSPQICTLNGGVASCQGCIAGYQWSDDAMRCIASCSVITCKSGEQCLEGSTLHDAQCVAAPKCQSECQRDGICLASAAGDACCYGAPADCPYDVLTTPGKEILLCTQPGNTQPPTGTTSCSAALGAFVWADAEDSLYDPNVLKWADATGPSFQQTVWQ